MLETILKVLPSDLKEKKVGIVLISKDGFYLGEQGQLPKRPPFDKELITYIAKDKLVLCSPNTEPTLPPSIKKVARGITTDINSDWEVNFGIKSFSEKCDYFIVVVSDTNLEEGKKFTIDRLIKMYGNMKSHIIGDFSLLVFE